MNHPDPFAASFLEAAPYLARFRGEHFVLWIGHELRGAQASALAEEIALVHALGVQLTVIVDAAPSVREPMDAVAHAAADRAGLVALSQWVDLLSRGWIGMVDRKYRLSVVTGNMVTARRLGIVQGVDHGHLGVVRDIDCERIAALHSGGNLLLFSGSIPGTTGLQLWTPPLDLAAETAVRTRAIKLVLISAGLKLGQPDEWSVERLNAARPGAGKRIADLLATASWALQQGVPRVHLVDGTQHGALIRELFSRSGSGIMIARDPSTEVTRAHPEDVSPIVGLLSLREPEGGIAPRSRDLIEASLDGFRVLRHDGRIVACGGIRRFVEAADAALIESVAVHPDAAGAGFGTMLLRALEREARLSGAVRAFLYTTAAEEWFATFGYRPIDVAAAPAPIAAALRPERNSVLMVRELAADDERTPL